MTALLLVGSHLAVAIGAWVICTRHHAARALDAHLAAVKADVFAESGERLYDEKQALEAAYTPELNRQRDKALRWREIALRGRRTA